MGYDVLSHAVWNSHSPDTSYDIQTAQSARRELQYPPAAPPIQCMLPHPTLAHSQAHDVGVAHPAQDARLELQRLQRRPLQLAIHGAHVSELDGDGHVAVVASIHAAARTLAQRLIA